MPKMTHPYDRAHVIDVPDEKVATYEDRGWSVRAEATKTPVTKRAAKKSAAKG